MKRTLCILVFLTSIGIACLADKPDVLAQQIGWPLRALRIDHLSETPTETVAEKFSAFQETLRKEYRVTLPIYLSPGLAKMEITGWSRHSGTATPLVKASIEDAIRLFCEMAGCSYEVRDGNVLLKEGSANKPSERTR